MRVLVCARGEGTQSWDTTARVTLGRARRDQHARHSLKHPLTVMRSTRASTRLNAALGMAPTGATADQVLALCESTTLGVSDPGTFKELKPWSTPWKTHNPGQPRSTSVNPGQQWSTHRDAQLPSLHALKHHVQHLGEGRFGSGLVDLAAADQVDVVRSAHSQQERLWENEVITGVK